MKLASYLKKSLLSIFYIWILPDVFYPFFLMYFSETYPILEDKIIFYDWVNIICFHNWGSFICFQSFCYVNA